MSVFTHFWDAVITFSDFAVQLRAGIKIQAVLCCLKFVQLYLRNGRMSMDFLWCSIAYSRTYFLTISVSGDSNAAESHVSAGNLVLATL